LNELKEAHKAQHVETIDSATEKLTQAWSAASQDIYAAQQAAGGNSDAGASASGGAKDNAGDVTDVEFEEVEDKTI